jgi:hypothetical protein
MTDRSIHDNVNIKMGLKEGEYEVDLFGTG